MVQLDQSLTIPRMPRRPSKPNPKARRILIDLEQRSTVGPFKADFEKHCEDNLDVYGEKGSEKRRSFQTQKKYTSLWQKAKRSGLHKNIKTLTP